MTVSEYIEDDQDNGNIIFNFGLMKNISSFGEVSGYSYICGGGYEASHEWVMHNVEDIRKSENKKYKGWTITEPNTQREKRVYIKKAILNMEAKNWKHALSLFSKFLTLKIEKQTYRY